MATVKVHDGRDSSYLFIDYYFTVSGRDWYCYAALKLQMGSYNNFDAWNNTNAYSATLQKNGSERYLAGNTYTLVASREVARGTYDVYGNAPTVHVTWAWNVNSSWGGYVNPHNTDPGQALTGPAIGPAGSAPSGGYVESLTSTWNSVTGKYGITSDGGNTLNRLIFKVLKAPYVAGVPAREYRATVPGDMSLNPRTRTVNNSSDTENNPTWTFKGCDLYYAGIYASNSIGEYRYQDGSVYTPPAPGQLSYVDPENVGTKNYTVSYTGVAANNATDYTPSELVRTVRYKIDGGSWVYQEQDTQATITDVTTFTLPLPASSVATVEAWMTYRGLQSEVSTITITNSNSPVNAYCSVNDETALVDKIYGSVNDVTAKVVKVYASHEGVARKVFEDTSS